MKTTPSPKVKKSFRSPSGVMIFLLSSFMMIIPLSMFAAGQVFRPGVGLVAQGLYLLFYGGMGAICAFGIVRSLFLRTTVEGSKVSIYSWFTKEEVINKEWRPEPNGSSVLPTWAPVYTNDNGEDVMLTHMAWYGIPFSGKPPKKISDMCAAFNGKNEPSLRA